MVYQIENISPRTKNLIKVKNRVRSWPGYQVLTNIRKSIVVLKKAYQSRYLNILQSILPKNYYIQDMQSAIRVSDKFDNIHILRKNYFSRSNRILLRDCNRIHNLAFIMNHVNRLDAGEIAELGAYRGAFAHCIWHLKSSQNKLYVFDSFEGFNEKDVAKEKIETGIATHSQYFSDTNMDLVKRNILHNSTSDESNLVLVKGYFPESFAGYEEIKWRFVNLDFDLYAPTKAALTLFWQKLVPGGILLVHDYMSIYTGVEKAVEEFSKEFGIYPIPLCDKSGSAAFIKQPCDV